MTELLKKINLVYRYAHDNVFMGNYYTVLGVLWQYDKLLAGSSASKLYRVNELVATGLITQAQAKQLLGMK